jgi:hypothetical protein
MLGTYMVVITHLAAKGADSDARSGASTQEEAI